MGISAILSTFSFLLLSCSFVHAGMDSCYEDDGVANLCMPKFENAAFNRTVSASNVCGSPPEDYCMQTGSTRSCHQCDISDPLRNHDATYLTDFHNDEEPTWWQSQSMFYGVQYPNSVNLTLNLGKAFEITYVRLKFYTSRPESFAIYKRTTETSPWQPYQFYSASCRKTYGRDRMGFIRPGSEERTALCTDEFSDISPLTGGNVAFSTLEGRPSAYNFDQSPTLQEWVTATDLLISLDRLNTFGDEFFKDAKVMRSYFYAISDLSIGGRCKCNGHAGECATSEDGRLACVCEHHTAGPDCERCAPFYEDRPWARATADSANECVMCNCSGQSEECVFDAEQYRSTGSGGRCVGCRDHTAGPHCERCRENFYRASATGLCTNCSCNPMGSMSLQCDKEGVCSCRTSVSGMKCDVCKPGFHSLAPGGCRSCECDTRGSIGVCSPEDGRCHCKTNVEGHACDRCKPGSFNLQQEDPEGCQSCFCFGHSHVCSSSNQHTSVNISSDFLEDQDDWMGQFSSGLETLLLWKEGEVYLLPYSEEDSGFYRAPGKFLGNQLLSYGQNLWLWFSAEAEELLPRSVSVVLEGSGRSVSADLSPQPGASPQDSQNVQSTFILRWSEREMKPSISALEFRQLLFNLTALRISNAGGHNYTSQLSGVVLASATPVGDIPAAGVGVGGAPWVEVCSCPPGYAGQFCESCAPGYTRETPYMGPFSPCVPCNCNQHGTCHTETGVCHCTDFTTGPSCNRCLDGYYGNALTGSPGDCLPCPCPDHTTCAQVPETGEVVCTNCPNHQRGTRCELCEDGFHGDPLGRTGDARACARCRCNGNVDVNAVGVCDHVTGRCLKCLGHTRGDHCERCQSGYYGNAQDGSLPPEQKCKSCACSPAGTSGSVDDCHPSTGSCSCLSHVTGRDCGQCEVGYFNLQPGLGCERCNCNPIGSSSMACNPITGQCVCRTGVEGVLCDTCRMGFFGFSSRGCRACNCDPMGSESMQCHGNGTCACRFGFIGYKCDRCELNYYHDRLTHECQECPICYSIIRDQAGRLKGELQNLEKLLSSYDCRGHRRQRYGRQHRVHEHQGEDYLPNALEDFLAIQEAREAFISQFTELQTAAQTLHMQLRSIATTLNCSLSNEGKEGKEEEEEGEAEREQGRMTNECGALAETLAEVSDAQSQLERAMVDLNNMVIPFTIPKGPNQWNAAVNESATLQKSHTEMAAHIELIANGALKASNRTYSLLQSLLDFRSTETDIQDLAEKLSVMQQLKENLTAQVNETLAGHLSAQQRSAEAAAILENVTSSLPSLREMAALDVSSLSDFNQTLLPPPQNQTAISATRNLTYMQDLTNRIAELDVLVQSKEQLVNKTREEMQSQIKSTHRNLKTIQDFHKLEVVAKGLKAEALSSVVTGKGVESEIMKLQRDLDGMQREWPRLQTQTRGALRKERVMEEKLLVEVKKRVKQGERVLKPALENATLARDTANQAEDSANAVAKEARDTLSQTKPMKSVSAQLSSSVHATLEQLAVQESRATHTRSRLETDEGDVSLESVVNSMESAKHQLEAYTHTLTELLSKLEGNTAVEKFDRILNDTASRLLVLRHSMENPVLSGKIRKLRNAAQDQENQLLHLDQNLKEIREERDSLSDIAQNLPKTCPQRGD